MKDTRFVFNPASDESVDDEYVLLGTQVTIQVAPYMGAREKYGVNKWLPDEEAMEWHGNFPTLKAAMAKALEVA